MKKLVLVLGIATLFSCEKEENKVCDCKTEIQRSMSNIDGGWVVASEQKDNNWHWETIFVTQYRKDFCGNATDWTQTNMYERERITCK